MLTEGETEGDLGSKLVKNSQSLGNKIKKASKSFVFTLFWHSMDVLNSSFSLKSQMLYQLSYGCGVKLLKIHFTFKAINPAFYPILL